jgi:hypothetical protein
MDLEGQTSADEIVAPDDEDRPILEQRRGVVLARSLKLAGLLRAAF